MIDTLRHKGIEFFERFGTRHDKIFIIPTRYGLYFIVIVFILFLISLSYGHSLAFTTTFVFVALVMTSAHFTNFNLAGVEVVAIYPPDEVQAGQSFEVKVTVRNSTAKHRFDIFLKVGAYGESDSFSLAPEATHTEILTFNPLTRGDYLIKRITVGTTFPFGLFYAWKYWYEQRSLSIFPELPDDKPALPRSLANNQEKGSHKGRPELGAEEFFGHQNYDVGMPLRAIDWKAYARGKGLLLKKFIEQSDIQYVLYRKDYLGEEVTNPEESLRALAALIDEAEGSGSHYAIVLDNEGPKFGRGHSFKRECLKRLAHYQKEQQVLI